MSVNNVSPQSFMGGTWVAWGAGRVPVGVNTSDSSFDTVEKTGGEKTHTLTEAEMPRHRHTAGNLHSNSGSLQINGAYWGPHSADVMDTSYTGGDEAHNNLQPYITCYMWKRTA